MSLFQNRPDRIVTFKCLDIVRTPASGALKGVITCEKSVGCWTHFWGGKTVPCSDSLCAACEDKAAKRWHSYITIWTSTPSRHVICELTLAAAEDLWVFEDKHGSLREVHVTLARRGVKANGRVNIDLQFKGRGQMMLPHEVDIEQQLRVIWGLELRERAATTTAEDIEAIRNATRDLDRFHAHPAPNHKANGSQLPG